MRIATSGILAVSGCEKSNYFVYTDESTDFFPDFDSCRESRSHPYGWWSGKHLAKGVLMEVLEVREMRAIDCYQVKTDFGANGWIRVDVRARLRKFKQVPFDL